MVFGLLLTVCQSAATEEPATPEATAPQEAATEAPAAEVTGSVGVVLPTRDEPRFKDAFPEAGYDVEILFSEGDSSKERQNEKPDHQRSTGHHHLPTRCYGGCSRG
jgi:putative multiple sugar transport system substrate-binding protein